MVFPDRGDHSPYTIEHRPTSRCGPIGSGIEEGEATTAHMPTTANRARVEEEEYATREGGELDFSSFLTGTAAEVKGYVRTQKRYLQLHLGERAALLMGRLLANVVLAVALGFMLLFLNLALALYLGEVLNSAPLGFVLVAALYLLLFGIFRLWWTQGGRDGFLLDRINDFTDNDDVQGH